MEKVENEKMKVANSSSASGHNPSSSSSYPSGYKNEEIGSVSESLERSGFYMFMNSKKQTELQKNINSPCKTKNDVSAFYKNLWEKLPAGEQRKWINDARDLGDLMFNSAPSAAALNIPDNMYRRLDPMTRDHVIQECVKKIVLSGCKENSCDFQLKSFAVIHFNVYVWRTMDDIIPAEYGVGSFSLQEGLSRCAGALLYPAIQDPSCMSSVYEAKAKLGLPLPPISTTMKGEIDAKNLYPFRFKDGLKEILEAGRQWDLQKNSTTPVVLFTLHEEDMRVEKCIEWLLKRCGESCELRVYPFTSLMKVLSQMGQNIYGGDSVIEFDSEAQSYLRESTYNYVQEFGCSWHQQEEHIDYISMCSRNIAYRSCLLGRNAILKNYKNDDGSPAATEGILKLGRRDAAGF